MGLTRYEYLQLFDRVNLLPYFPGKHKRDDKFPMSPAKLAALVMRPLLAGRRVVLVGRGVANAFGVEAEFHQWSVLEARRYCPIQREPHAIHLAVVPHPSGRNRWYNQDENLQLARDFWRRELEEKRACLLRPKSV